MRTLVSRHGQTKRYALTALHCTDSTAQQSNSANNVTLDSSLSPSCMIIALAVRHLTTSLKKVRIVNVASVKAHRRAFHVDRGNADGLDCIEVHRTGNGKCHLIN